MSERQILTDELNSFYENVIVDLLDSIQEMRETGDYDESTLEALEWRISPPVEVEGV
jgi:hypothetical protein